ncbi:UDP-N-acetylglucosamine 1-carboxyvinyltransferase [Brucella anthropi]|uniref:UDP-N-acetylglucosamine 1-carboxyvinyltransferase n=1 Tax=Brucella anthropi (strain ATCC 49188 / DSM 6882 / CCUG 24695 / JCM 21032 / LMG 3331 / NBRC 15819 / NCTC 12168 / Alc 37) TaxID=439375 RepID=A6X3M7_BRUA4|nr:UDP-N-acetylglucosamine 1-carboxyvinyltransferase [Brucella anthropi]ABS15831.1 UDP-N-acetylglucosamine 1-carboxyvinyltransferase [Brucella anthropi ATCC 49188]AIK42776.1 UDP-N-acetylglucosamine 1-carboxyvinyltransferase [Brucella anthropi]KAB2735410.1 UDP-N-acetylglucosamine 1-carboxyvinyltransferase [Brucella anthropi]KAB2751245.1 UDP-N-acetylglucosamine 1-carboxyvinyltransferase [Brucella anthropi]KAB2777790.1 UDP-N-acetylglucosamine 1-carboxyvinyltransferase [Brucella anthropi]
MERLRIVGGRPLQGAVNISGAKNAALPQIAASLLSPHPVELTNLPAVSDVENMLNVVQSHGAQVSRAPHSTTVTATDVVGGETPYDTVRRMRATVLVLAPLLARLGKVRVSLPGGCAIGARPVDMHLKALATLGADVSIDRGWIVASTDNGLIGSRIVLPAPSVGATATAMMAATSARGETEILNAAREPEIGDLAACLGGMGAQIEGAGTHRILIQGDTSWRTARHHGIPDRIEAGTYAVAAAITGGTLELTHARLEHLASVVQVLETMGVSVWPSDRGLVVSRSGSLRGTDLTTEPYPGFPTDLQAQFMALAACAEGASLIRETVFESRFMHVPELMRLGADIKLHGTTALVRGGRPLHGAQVMATDLRASVSLVLAALVAEGETVVNRIYHLDRGYEQLDRKLKLCGADIERLSE